MKKTTYAIAINAAAAATNSGYVDTSNFEKINIEVVYTGDAVDSAFTLTCYGSVNGDATSRYALGIAPALNETRDADGVVVYNATSSTLLYNVIGVHPYIYLAISSVTDDIVVTINIIGQEHN